MALRLATRQRWRCGLVTVAIFMSRNALQKLCRPLFASVRQIGWQSQIHRDLEVITGMGSKTYEKLYTPHRIQLHGSETSGFSVKNM